MQYGLCQVNFDRHYETGFYSESFFVKQISGGKFLTLGYNHDSSPPFTTGVLKGILVIVDSIGDTVMIKKVGTDTSFHFFQYACNVNDSEFIAVGAYANSSFNAYDYDLYLVRFNLNLDTIWTRTISHFGTQALKPHSIIKTKDGHYVIGGYQNDWSNDWFTSFLMKIDGQGNSLWYKNYTTPGDHTIWGVAEANNGDLICSGTNYNTVDLSNLLIVKTDSMGNNYQVLHDIATTDRNFGTMVMRTEANNFIVAGLRRGCFTCDAYSWAILMDSAGTIIWDRTHVPARDESGYSVIMPLANNAYLGIGVVNRYQESQRGLILKMDANGDSLWSREFYTPGSIEIFWDVDTTSDGGFILCGETYCCNFNPGFGYTSSLWLVKTDSLGFITTGINDLPGYHLYSMGQGYPNPANTVLHVPLDIPHATATPATNGLAGNYLYVFDMQGRQLMQQKVQPGNSTAQLDVSTLAPGTYSIVLVAEGYSISHQKFVVLR